MCGSCISSAMQVVRKEDLCVVSLRNESKDDAWIASHNRLALVAQAGNAAHSEEISVTMYIKLCSCVPFYHYCPCTKPQRQHSFRGYKPYHCIVTLSLACSLCLTPVPRLPVWTW